MTLLLITIATLASAHNGFGGYCLSHSAILNTIALYYHNVMIVMIWYIVCGISLHSALILF